MVIDTDNIIDGWKLNESGKLYLIIKNEDGSIYTLTLPSKEMFPAKDAKLSGKGK